jgi:Mrp family chromosome partitioning ATPase
MTTILGLLAEPAPAEQPRVTPIREQARRKPVSPAHSASADSVRTDSVRNDQIHALVQQLFFGHELRPVRHVGFATVEASTETATLCLEVATALAEENRYDVGLIDAHSDPALLQTQLHIPVPNKAEATWPIASHLWMVPRQSWQPEPRGQRINEQNLSRLRELTDEFDFTVLWCAPVSWVTASIGQTCDGVVLVLTANKTRRLVAAQIKDQLSKARVPLLGTVLAERRFPVPQGLYRSL